jgi:hypothetical protein
MKEVSLVIILDFFYIIFFDRFKIDELIEKHGHKVLLLPPYHCHFNSIELVWSQAKRYYSSNIGQSGFWMEAVKKVWEESLVQICSFCSMTTKQRRALLHEFFPLKILCIFIIECRHNSTNVVSQLSGNTSNVGILFVTYREADEGELGNRTCASSYY